jgi:hypothetical protein
VAATLGTRLGPVGRLIILDRDGGPDVVSAQVGSVGLGAVGLVGQDPVRPGAWPAPARAWHPDPLQDRGKLGTVPALPGGITIDSGRWPWSQPSCSLLVSPPRDRPSPWSAGSATHHRASVVAGPPFAGASGRLVRPRDGGIHADVPTDQPGRIGTRLQPGQDLPPGPVALPAPKQPIDRRPWP